jgi:hypothetical protein
MDVAKARADRSRMQRASARSCTQLRRQEGPVLQNLQPQSLAAPPGFHGCAGCAIEGCPDLVAQWMVGSPAICHLEGQLQTLMTNVKG